MIDVEANLSHYPNLEKSFNSLDSSIRGGLTFDALKKQLAWAFDDYEQKRAIHRLHCVITSLLSKNTIHFQNLSADQKQALIVLTILDGCKNSNESIEAFSSKGFSPLKDGVPSLFDMLAKAPEIFPIYQQLSKEAKEVIKNEFFYLHLRHLQLGEVPVASVSKEALARPRNLMVAFWYANATGFSIEKPDYPIGEKTGPTISDDQRDQFEKLLVALKNNNLTDYYAKDSIFKERSYFKASFSEEDGGEDGEEKLEFICRLGKMLSFVKLKEDDNDYLKFVYNNKVLIKDLVSLEAKTFSEHKIEAFTFLPAVLNALKERVMPGKETAEILGVFLSLRRQLYLSTPMIIECIGANRTIPLHGLSTSQDQMLKMFADSDNKQGFHFEASMEKFINVNLLTGPVLNLTERNKATASNK